MGFDLSGVPVENTYTRDCLGGEEGSFVGPVMEMRGKGESTYKVTKWVYEMGKERRGATRKGDGCRMWEGEKYTREGWNGRPDGNESVKEHEKDEGRPWSAVCGWINGIPGTWSRENVLRALEGFGEVVAIHIRLAKDQGRM